MIKRYHLFHLKRMLEDILMLPFIAWGKWLSGRYPLEGSYEIFFFFPFYHIGGAEKVHANIANALRHRRAVIFFTRKSANDFFLQEFRNSGHHIVDISAFTDNKWKYWNNLIYRGLISAYINHQGGSKVVFNGQSNFGYKVSAWINRDIPQIELIHSFSSFSLIRIPFIEFYRRTVMISLNRIKDHLDQYKKTGIPENYHHTIKYIINGIPLPPLQLPKTFAGAEIKLLYAGRDTPEKRVHLVSEIESACSAAKLPVSLVYMGDVSGVIQETGHSNIKFYGNVGDERLIDSIYQGADVLLITSSEEGFPMVVMEAMARGCIILATPVGDITIHIRQGINGFLFGDAIDESKIIEEGVRYIERLLSDPELCATMSANNIKYAADHFGLATFEKNYQELIDNYLS